MKTEETREEWEIEFDELFETNIIVALTAKSDKYNMLDGTYYPDDEIGGNIQKNLKAFIYHLLQQEREKTRQDERDDLEMELLSKAIAKGGLKSKDIEKIFAALKGLRKE